LKNFEGAPQSIEELIEFNNQHAEQEFTERKPPIAQELAELRKIGNDNQKILESARDTNMTQDIFDRNFKALRDTASKSVLDLLKEYDLDVIIGPADSRTASVGAASGFPVANLPLGFADFNGRAFALHMIAPDRHEAKMLQIMAAWEATFPNNVRPSPLLLES
jgi:amidase